MKYNSLKGKIDYQVRSVKVVIMRVYDDFLWKKNYLDDELK